MNRGARLRGNSIRAATAALLVFSATPAVSAQEPFDSLSVSEAIAQALARNATLRSAKAQRSSANAMVREAKSGYLPQVTLSAGYTRYEEPNIIVPIHQVGVFPPLDNDIYSGSANITLPLFNGARTPANVGAANALANELDAREDYTETELLLVVGELFVRTQELADQKALLDRRLQSLTQRRKEFSILLEEGRVAPSDVALVNSSIATTESDLLDARSRANQLAFRLQQLVGSDRPISAKAPAGAPPSGIALDRGAHPVAAPTTSGPRVRMAEAQLSAANARQSLAKSYLWPEISAFASYSIRSGDSLDAIAEWFAGVTIQFPLFDGGRRRSAVRAARASTEAAKYRLDAETREQQAGLDIALEQWQVADDRRVRLGEAVREKAMSVETFRRLHQEGRLSLSELQTQETELLALQLDERSLLHAARIAVLQYNAILGTMSPELVSRVVGEMS